MINSFGTSVIEPDKIAEIINEVFDFRPSQIIKKLNLLRPIFRKTSAYGHFGREEDGFTWEKTDMADILKEKAGI
jgi:S-adenosylmethionine synthetase